MAVRNFWVDAYIDGRQTRLSGGPRAKDGGMDINIFQRSENGIETAVVIRCWEHHGKLETVVQAQVPGNETYALKEVARYETDR